jgi:hypothetical protein
LREVFSPNRIREKVDDFSHAIGYGQFSKRHALLLFDNSVVNDWPSVAG